MQSLPDQQISLHIQRIALAHRLGKPQVIYTSRNASSLSRVFGFLALLIGCLVIGLLLYFFISTDLLSSWSLWQIALILLVSAAWLAIGAWITFASMHSHKLSVVVCPEGLIYIKSKIQIMRWEQIAEFWKDIKIDRKAQLSHVYTLHLLDGTTWIFTDDLMNVGELGAIVEDELLCRLLPYASAAYLAGKPLSFGAITLSRWGVSVQKEVPCGLPWGLVQRLHLDDSSLSLYKIGEFWDWVTLPVATIPNVGVLKSLVELVLLEHTPAALSMLIARYRAGLPINFGRLQMSLRGVDIIDGETVIPWNEIVGIGVGPGEVILKRRGNFAGSYTIPLSFVSNVQLLRDFLDYLHTRDMPH